MIITAEISYYPLTNDYSTPVEQFIQALAKADITIETGKMSTILTGDYHDIMKLLTDSMDELMREYPSIFNIRISNACPV